MMAVLSALDLKNICTYEAFQSVVTKTSNDHKSPQLSTYDHKPPANDHKPPANDRKPPANDHKPPANNHKPPNRPVPNSNYLIFL